MTEHRWRLLLPRLREYVHRAWLADAPTTINGAAEALGELRDRCGGKGNAASTPVLTLFDHLESIGVAVRDPGLSSRKTRVIEWWNWSGLPLDNQSLRTALEGYLAAPTYPRATPESDRPDACLVTLPDGRERVLHPVSVEEMYAVLSAVRALVRARFGTAACGPKGPEGRSLLLASCERISAAELPGLVAEVKRLGGGSAEVYVTHLNYLRRYAASHDLVALRMRAPMHHHPWAAWSQDHGVTPAQRPSLYSLHEILSTMRGTAVPPSPDSVSVADANEALQRLSAGKGKGRGKRVAADVRSLLVSLGLRGLGPYRALADECSLVRSGARAVRPRWVVPAEGDDEAQTWESTASVLATHGFPAIWGDFYAWFARYSMLPLESLQEEWGSEFTRPGRRLLDATTTRQRHTAIRTWLGVAVHLLGIEAADCTPQRAFGTEFRAIMAAFRKAWAARVREQERLGELGLPVPGQRVTLDSPTLPRHIINAGLIAEALAVWGEWCASQGNSVATDADCARWRAAYQLARDAVDQKEGGRTSTLRSRRRTRKDLSTIMADVSSLALVERSNRRAMERIRTAPQDRETAVFVQRAILGALTAMGAPRIGELGLLEFQRHYRRQESQAEGRSITRFLALDSDSRKAGGDHQIPLPEDVAPLALWEWHRTAGRALLMEPWIASGAAPHDAIFCSPQSGGPFGGLPDYAEREPIRRQEDIARCESNASSALSEQFTVWRKGELRAHPSFSLLEGGRGHHGPHAERNRATRLVTSLGMADRLPYLLGHATRSGSEEMYGMPLAEVNAETVRAILKAAPWLRGASPDVYAPTTIDGMRSRTRQARAQLERDAHLGREVRALLARLPDLTERQTRRVVEELSDRFGVAPADAA